jgi:hypothetical protein
MSQASPLQQQHPSFIECFLPLWFFASFFIGHESPLQQQSGIEQQESLVSVLPDGVWTNAAAEKVSAMPSNAAPHSLLMFLMIISPDSKR